MTQIILCDNDDFMSVRANNLMGYRWLFALPKCSVISTWLHHEKNVVLPQNCVSAHKASRVGKKSVVSHQIVCVNQYEIIVITQNCLRAPPKRHLQYRNASCRSLSVNNSFVLRFSTTVPAGNTQTATIEHATAQPRGWEEPVDETNDRSCSINSQAYLWIFFVSRVKIH